MEIKVLDHGFVRLVEAWGHGDAGTGAEPDTECGIIEAARQSTQGSFRGWDDKTCKECSGCPNVYYEDRKRVCPVCEGRGKERGDARLLKYLYENRHSTPFEFAGMVIEVRAPIFVFREWHRHRTQCLHPDTLIHFDTPRSRRSGRHTVTKHRIEDLWKKWQPTHRRDRPERQTNLYFPRSRVQGMQLRSLNETENEFFSGRIVDVIRGDIREMLRITTTTGKTIAASRDHKFFTNEGWLTLQEAIDENALFVTEGTARGKEQTWEIEKPTTPEEWRPVLHWEGTYAVSSHGRVKRVVGGRGTRAGTIKTPTIGPGGYPVIGLTYQGRARVYTVHSLVAQAFFGIKDGEEVRHKNDNRLDCRLENLVPGSSKDNSQDMKQHDRHPRLVPSYESIYSIEEIGDVQCYDLSVHGPWHNFVANGFVVHNSYNEMSARYAPLPDVNYLPSVDRCFAVSATNKQAGAVKGAEGPTHEAALEWLEEQAALYTRFEAHYQKGLRIGVPKEIARIGMPIGRYSQMRASANLRNWLAFVTLRSHPNAQEEIRQYSFAVELILSKTFPRTYALFKGAAL